MKDFDAIVGAMGLGGGAVQIGDDPPLVVNLNAGGGGYQRSLVAALSGNPGVHVTIYQSSWDGTANIRDYDGTQVQVGPYCLHMTAEGVGRCFYEIGIGGIPRQVTDHFIPNENRVRVALQAFLRSLGPYLA